MHAGLAREKITPPLGSRMSGFTSYETLGGCQAVHDDLFVRALYLRDGPEEALLLAYDLLFCSRRTTARFSAALGQALGLAPHQILHNFSHTHTGTATDMWAWDNYRSPDAAYLSALEQATLTAAARARQSAQEVTLWAGEGRTRLPLSRRLLTAAGRAEWAPAPEGLTYPALPVCLFRTLAGDPLALVFSVSCHPSTLGAPQISADYPGAATARLDAALGGSVSLFLQGVGGDAKPHQVAAGGAWHSGSWEDVAAEGKEVASEVLAVAEGGLHPVEPRLRAASVETLWPLAPLPSPADLAACRDDPAEPDLKRRWAEELLRRLAAGQTLSPVLPMALHGLQLGVGLRLLGLEGEAVAAWGPLLAGYYPSGGTFPLGYTGGTQAYLPVTPMLSQGGYEVESWYEYDVPAPFAPGMEALVLAGLNHLHAAGIE